MRPLDPKKLVNRIERSRLAPSQFDLLSSSLFSIFIFFKSSHDVLKSRKRPERHRKIIEFRKTSEKPGKLMEFWKNDLKFWSRLYFKLLIIIWKYSDAVKKQKEEEKKKGKENLRKRQISNKMQELKETKNSIGKAKRTWRHRRRNSWTN